MRCLFNKNGSYVNKVNLDRSLQKISPVNRPVGKHLKIKGYLKQMKLNFIDF